MSGQLLRPLENSQLQAFADYDYISDELFSGIAAQIIRDFPDGRFAFLDVGGGCGYFADHLLGYFPQARATVLDNSELLLSQNSSNDRKRTVLASATDLVDRFAGRPFDLVFFNLSLHHFVASTYTKTRRMQREALTQALAVLAPGGRIIVTENLYDGTPADNLPGFLIYTLTSSKVLAPVIKRLGANTAGCGVCFLSARAWRNEFQRLGMLERAFSSEDWTERELWRALRQRLLGVRCVSRGFFWLVPAS